MDDDFYAEQARKRAELLRLFDTLPTTTIIGAVGATGPSGGKIGDDVWSLHVELISWKPEGGPLQAGALRLWKEMSHAELGKLQDQMRAESLYRLRVKVAYQNPFGSPQALLVGVMGDAHDDDVMRALREFQIPVTIADARLGTFTFDRRVEWFASKAEWCGRGIDLNLSVAEASQAAPLLATAHALWNQMLEWNSRITRYAADELLALKNESWLDDDEKEVSAEEFVERLALQSITVYEDGEFEFGFEDGELFWGHFIVVSGSLSEGPKDASIAG